MIFVDAFMRRREQRMFWAYFREYHEFRTFFTNGIALSLNIPRCSSFIIHTLLATWKEQATIATAIVVIRIYHIRIIHYIVQVIRANIVVMQRRTNEATVLRGVVKKSPQEVLVIHEITIKMVECSNTIFCSFIIRSGFIFYFFSIADGSKLDLKEQVGFFFLNWNFIGNTTFLLMLGCFCLKAFPYGQLIPYL